MKFKIFLFSIIVTGLSINPVFVQAGSTCYVDKDASSGGDGTKESPYTKISKALSEDCKEISVKKGAYGEDITLGKDVEIEGVDRDDVVITGKVTMKSGSKIEKVTISGVKGVQISNNAAAKINNVTIKNAGTGIETSGSGKLTLSNSKVSGNGKGLYLQVGKNISITSSIISDNTEEGIDIRSNVDGVISGNTIEDNGESGIEVVLGKSDLTISNNKIKNNRASGVATQFYDLASELGGVKINNNTISKNNDFAVNCKVPSGGTLSAGYWSKSVSFVGNVIENNKDGAFAPNCNFSELDIENATKTEEELEAEEKERLDALEKLKEDPGEAVGKIKVLQTPAGRLNVRAGPSTSNEIVSSIKTGEEYEYVSKENGWYKTIVNDSLWGWVFGGYVEEVIEKESVEDTVEEPVIAEPIEVVSEITEEEIVEEDKNNDTIVFGSVAAALIAFLIFLFSPLPDKIFAKREKTFILIKERRDNDIDNF